MGTQIPLIQTQLITEAVATTFYPVGSGGNAINSTTESGTKTTQRTAGTYSGLYVRVGTSHASGTSTLTFRKNGANGNQTFTIPTSTTGDFTDSTHSDAVVAADTVDIQFAETGVTVGIQALSVLFTPTSNTVNKLTANTSISQTSASTSLFQQLSGLTSSASNASTESKVQFKVKTAATFQNLFVNVTTNSRAQVTVVRFRKNTANGNLVASITGNTTGVFEDTAHTDTVASGDLCNTVFTTGTSTGTVTINNIVVEMATTNNKTHYIASNTSSPFTASNGQTSYWGLTTTATAGFGTEASAQITSQLACSATNLECFVLTNSTGATSSIHFRQNAGNGGNVCTIGSGVTGYVEDTTHTDTVLATDLINYQIVPGGSIGNSISFSNIGILFDYTQPNATVNAVGVAGTGAFGNSTIQLSPVVTGVSATGSVGTASTTISPTITGIAGTGQVGSPSLNVSSNISVTGISATGSVGSSSETLSPGVTGISATGAFGSSIVTISPPITGIAGVGAVGNVTTNVQPQFVGIEGIGTVGTVTVTTPSGDVIVDAVGIQGTGSIGSPAPEVSPNFSGISATGSVGNVTNSILPTITGIAATGSIGTSAPVIQTSITGISAIGSVGSILSQNQTSPTGISGTGACGTSGVQIAPAVTGVSATGAVGNVTVDLEKSVFPTGIAGVGAIGSMKTAISNIVSGIEGQGQVGGVTLDIGFLSGIQGNGFFGGSGLVILITNYGVYATALFDTAFGKQALYDTQSNDNALYDLVVANGSQFDYTADNVALHDVQNEGTPLVI